MVLRSIILCIIAGPSLLLAAETTELNGPTMGTEWNVRYVGDAPVEPLQAAIGERLDAINRLMSTYDPESELSRFNATADQEWFGLSPETFTVVSRSIEIWRLTDGAFDPTVGRLVRLWDFGPNRDAQLPTEDEIATALESVGCDRLELDAESIAVRKLHPDVELDLSAIAKGYAVDQVALLLDAAGVADYMVEIGGEVRVRGTRADGNSWNIGLEKPIEGSREVFSVLPLTDVSLATSGDYRNAYVVDGQRYSHTIDPGTGRPVEHPPGSVSVLADDCMTADAVATALMVLGAEKGVAWAESNDLAVCFLQRGTGTEIITKMSSRFETQFGPSVVAAIPKARQAGGDLWMTFLITFSVFATALLMLGVGTIVANRRLQGSCGGLSGMTDEHGHPMCQACTTPPEQCDQVRRAVTTPSDAHDFVEGD